MISFASHQGSAGCLFQVRGYSCAPPRCKSLSWTGRLDVAGMQDGVVSRAFVGGGARRSSRALDGVRKNIYVFLPLSQSSPTVIPHGTIL